MHCLLGFVFVCSFVAVFSEDCPPGTCQSGETCCPLPTPGEYRCCPIENAVCCMDHANCCPEGTECDLITGTCLAQSESRDDLVRFQDRLGEFEERYSDECQPGTCGFGETCCPTSTPGEFICCPYSNAVCCENNAFCCPENTECDLIEGVCASKESNVEAKLEKRQGIIDEEGNIQKKCDDGSLCEFDTTCCKVRGDKYGCCPHLQATCCPDGIHCCPQGQVCDVTSHYCIGKRTVSEEVVEEHALPIDVKDSE